MARFTFHLPDIGEGIAEAEIVAWHVKVGDRVEEDGRLADMMTDKATVEMESPVAGKIVEVAGEEGDVIAIGSPLVVLETEGEIPEEVVEATKRWPRKPMPPRRRPKRSSSGSRSRLPTPAMPKMRLLRKRHRQNPFVLSLSKDEVRSPTAQVRGSTGSPRTEKDKPSPASGPSSGAKVLASPAVRQRAAELGIDLGEVRPAEDGRVRHADLDAFLSYGASKGFAPAGKAMRDETIKVIGLRRRIAENMAASKRNIPHFSYVEECDVTDLEKLRADLNANRGAKPKLTLAAAADRRDLPGPARIPDDQRPL